MVTLSYCQLQKRTIVSNPQTKWTNERKEKLWEIWIEGIETEMFRISSWVEGVIIFQKYFGYKLSISIQAGWAQYKNKVEFLFMELCHLSQKSTESCFHLLWSKMVEICRFRKLIVVIVPKKFKFCSNIRQWWYACVQEPIGNKTKDAEKKEGGNHSWQGWAQ